MDYENEKLVIRIKQEYTYKKIFFFWLNFICNIYVWCWVLRTKWTICQFCWMFTVYNLRNEFIISTKISENWARLIRLIEMKKNHNRLNVNDAAHHKTRFHLWYAEKWAFWHNFHGIISFYQQNIHHFSDNWWISS